MENENFEQFLLSSLEESYRGGDSSIPTGVSLEGDSRGSARNYPRGELHPGPTLSPSKNKKRRRKKAKQEKTVAGSAAAGCPSTTAAPNSFHAGTGECPKKRQTNLQPGCSRFIGRG